MDPGVVAVLVGIAVIIVWVGYQQYSKTKAALEAIKPLASMPVLGKYVGGLSEAPKAVDGSTLAVTEDEFLLLNAYGKEIGGFDRESIKGVVVDDKSRVFQRLTATRIFFLGVYSLAAPKREESPKFVLVIDRRTSEEIDQPLLFEFSSRARANKVAAFIRQHALGQPDHIGRGERICPHCAETIKAQARVCRYCGRDLDPVS